MKNFLYRSQMALLTLFISGTLCAQNQHQNENLQPKITEKRIVESGSLFLENYSVIEKKTQMLKEISGAKIIYKSLQKGEVMPTHKNPTDVFIMVLSGKMNIIIEGETNSYVAGDYIYFSGDIFHELVCIEDAKILIIR